MLEIKEFLASIVRSFQDELPMETLDFPQDVRLVTAYQIGMHPDDRIFVLQRMDGTMFERSISEGDRNLSIPLGYNLLGVLQMGRSSERYYLLQNPATPGEVMKVRNDKLSDIPQLQ